MKDRLRGRYFGENEKISHSKIREWSQSVFTGRFPNGWSWEMILVKEVAWREETCSFKIRKKWKEKEYREKTEERKIKHCNSKSYFHSNFLTLYLVFDPPGHLECSIILWYPMYNLYLLYYIPELWGRTQTKDIYKNCRIEKARGDIKTFFYLRLKMKGYCKIHTYMT